MLVFLCLALMLVIVFRPASLWAATSSSLTDQSLIDIQFEQKIGSQITPGLRFRDEVGAAVKLGDYFGHNPMILVLGYYGCPMLCTLVLNGMIESLQDLKADMGKEFSVVSVSIDPTELPELAAAKKRMYLKRYGRDGAGNGWHFLTGAQTDIRQLAKEVGFHYAYDPASKQFAHPSGLIVLTPEGKVSKYLFGVSYPPADLNQALRDAGQHQVGSPIHQLVLLCFHYSPLRGKYGPLILTIIRVAGVATLLAVVFLAFRWGKSKNSRITASASSEPNATVSARPSTRETVR